MKYSDYNHDEKSFSSLTGISLQQFNELLPYFEEYHDEYFKNYDMNERFRNHNRTFVIYKSSPLPTIEDRLFFVLIYLKSNSPQKYHIPGFEMKSRHYNGFTRTLPRILEICLEECLEDNEFMPTDCREKFSEILKNMAEQRVVVVDASS